MTRPADGYRFALVRDGVPDMTTAFRLPSVTEILRVVNKPVLVNWAAKATREGIADLLAHDGLRGATQQDLASMLKTAGTDHNSLSRTGRSRGSKVHDLAEVIMLGRLYGDPDPTFTDDQRAVMATGAGIALLDWIDFRDPRPLAVEQSVVSLRHRYAGTFDLIAEVEIDDLPDEVRLVDFKTGRAGAPIYPETHLQTSAYAEAYAEMTGSTVIRDMLGVVFRDDGTWLEERLDWSLDAFLAALRLHEFMERMGTDARAS